MWVWVEVVRELSFLVVGRVKGAMVVTFCLKKLKVVDFGSCRRVVVELEMMMVVMGIRLVVTTDL